MTTGKSNRPEDVRLDCPRVRRERCRQIGGRHRRNRLVDDVVLREDFIPTGSLRALDEGSAGGRIHMGRIVVTEFVSLDGVMEDPGVRRLLDPRGTRMEQLDCAER